MMFDLGDKDISVQKSSSETDSDAGDSLTKRLVHSYAKNCVEMMLKGVATTHPALHVDINSHVIFLNRYRKNRVGLVSGGGSGHEPFSAGFVGENMLTCVVAGSIFTAPPSSLIASAIRRVADLNRGGVLVLINNYTGDIMNFGLAVEEVKAAGIEVDTVVFGDDVSLMEKADLNVTGRRGIAGCLFAFKIAGAMSSAGRCLSEIALTVHAINCRVGSMGFCLSPCSIPGQPPLFTLPKDRISLGIGVHGEAGASTIEMMPVEDIIKILLNQILKHMSKEPGNPMCVIVNNLGSSTTLELYLVAGEVHRQLSELGYEVRRMYVGTFMTSLEMNGLQISILNIVNREEWLDLLDLETEAFAWPGTRLSNPQRGQPPAIQQPNFAPSEQIEEAAPGSMELGGEAAYLVKSCLEGACKALISEEQKMNHLDSGCGDGDTGSTIGRLARCILSQLSVLTMGKISVLLLRLSKMAQQEMGGTSGCVYSLLFLGAARNAQDWVLAWNGALDLLRKYSSARLGYRTLLDSLIPACQAFTQKMKQSDGRDWKLALKTAVEQAAKGCDSTRNMKAKAGRASYVDQSLIVDVDAGAYGVVTWLSAIYRVLSSSPLLNE